MSRFVSFHRRCTRLVKNCYHPRCLYHTASAAGTRNCRPTPTLQLRSCSIQHAVQLRRIGKTPISSPETCNSTVVRKVPATTSRQWIISFHVQICGMYSRTFAIHPRFLLRLRLHLARKWWQGIASRSVLPCAGVSTGLCASSPPLRNAPLNHAVPASAITDRWEEAEMRGCRIRCQIGRPLLLKRAQGTCNMRSEPET